MPPVKAGRYQLLEELGRGAMGVVYKAFDPTIGRSVAVKTMRLTEERTGIALPELVARFQTETRAAGRLTHPNIVVVYDAGQDQGLFYITMEYVEGQSLHAAIGQKQDFPLPRVMRIIEQVSAALDFAHQRGVVHRDVKPANIMLATEDLVKITDFGTARILQTSGTQTGSIFGTPSYMSPEQVKGKPVDGRSDIFSLGVILYELVTGEKPFPGQNVTTVIYKIVNEDPVPPRELDSSIHPGLSYVITKALAKDLNARYQTCRELVEDLRNYRNLGGSLDATLVSTLRVLGPPLRPAPTMTHAAPPAATRPAAPAVAKAPPRPSAPLPPPLSAAVAEKKRAGFWLVPFLLVILAGGGYLVWPSLRDIFERSRASVSAPPPAERTAGQPQVQPLAAEQQPSRASPLEGRPLEHKQAEESPAESKLVTPQSAATSPTPFPGPDAAAPRVDPTRVRSLFERRLARTGYADKVRVDVAGNVVTLTGTLTPAEHNQLLQRLRGFAPRIRVNDRIQVAGAAPAEEEKKPRTAQGMGAIEVITDVLGARVVLRGPQGKLVLECWTPCRFEDLPPGRYTLQITKDGYRTVNRILQVRAGSILEEKISLQPMP